MKKSKLEIMFEHLNSVKFAYSKSPSFDLDSMGIKTDKDLSDYVRNVLLPEFEEIPYFKKCNHDEFKEAYFMENKNRRKIARYSGHGYISVNSRNKNEPEVPHALVHEIVHMKGVRFDEVFATLLGWEVSAMMALKGDSIQKSSLLCVLQSSLYSATYFQAKLDCKIEKWREKSIKIFGKDFVNETEELISNEDDFFLKSPLDYSLRPYNYVLNQMEKKKQILDFEIYNIIKFLKRINV